MRRMDEIARATREMGDKKANEEDVIHRLKKKANLGTSIFFFVLLLPYPIHHLPPLLSPPPRLSSFLSFSPFLLSFTEDLKKLQAQKADIEAVNEALTLKANIQDVNRALDHKTEEQKYERKEYNIIYIWRRVRGG